FPLRCCYLSKLHGLELQHLNRKCPFPKDMRFPQIMKVSLNIRGQDQVLGNDAWNRSLSPWNISYDQDANRIPHIIAEATCRHERCVDSEGDMDFSVNSIPIKQEILVLRRELSGCNHIFKLEKKTITVGCTCVRPKIQHLT
ncbi:hypothetical protein FKM82_011342, partial [Ascaphus truei]